MTWSKIIFSLVYLKTLFISQLCKRDQNNQNYQSIERLISWDDLLKLIFPINLRSMVSENWPFGDQSSEILCSLSMAAQKFPIFLSSMAIILIGWDRYRCVITPGR